MKICHISPTYYNDRSVIGGGERYVVYVTKALKTASRIHDRTLVNTLVAFGTEEETVRLSENIECRILPGEPWNVDSLDADKIKIELRQYDVVIVHQCLVGFGLFIAAQAKISGKIVIGFDHGGGEHPLVRYSSETAKVFDAFVAYSDFGNLAFVDLAPPAFVIKGPVDDQSYRPAGRERQQKQLVSVGRILPHKGFDRIIRSLPAGVNLSIIGQHYDREYLAYLMDISKNKDVNFFSALSDDEVRSYLQTSGLYVHASTMCDYRGKEYKKPELLGLAPLEALASGCPTFVSTAGALPELASVEGCKVFKDDAHLKYMLSQYAEGNVVWPAEPEIAASASNLYGLTQYGNKLCEVINRIAAGG